MTMSSSGPLKRLRRASGDPSRVSLTVIGVFDAVVPSACVVVSTRRDRGAGALRLLLADDV